MHLLNTPLALILPGAAWQLAFTMFLMRAYFISIRPDMEEAPRLDGADTWEIFWRASVPMVWPVMLGLRDRILDLFNRMTELENRDLFSAFHPYVWEAREETTHLVTYLDWLAGDPPVSAEFPDKDRIYNFYRQGFSVAVQELLPRHDSGRYQHGA